MRLLVIFSFLIIFSGTRAQVAINTDGSNPDPSAGLEVKFTDKGFLPPRLTAAQRDAITSPAAGLIIYNSTDNRLEYFSGVWAPLLSPGSGWSLSGNTGTTDGIDFIGNIDNKPLNFRVNNQAGGRIDHIYENTFLGYHSGNGITTGSNNTGSGAYSLEYNSTGTLNAAVGYYALRLNSTGSENAGIGAYALNNNMNGHYNTALGIRAMQGNSSGACNSAMGNEALIANTTGNNNVAIGMYAMQKNMSGSDGTAVGTGAMRYYNIITNPWIIANVAIGFNALRGSTTVSQNSGNYNTAVGYQSLQSNTQGNRNTGLGNQTLYLNTTGGDNTAIGYLSLSSNSTGISNTAVGSSSLSLSYGNYNSALGSFALANNQGGEFNSAFGTQALYGNTAGNYNTALGYQSMTATTTGWYNTAVGYRSSNNNPTGSYNTCIGYNSGSTAQVNFDNTTCIGTDAQATATDMVRIGNVYVNSIGGYANWTNISDGRFKTEVKENVPGIEFISMLRPVSYRLDREQINRYLGIESAYKAESVSQVICGFIAQEVEAAAQKTGFNFSGIDAPDNAGDLYGLRYAEFVVPLVKAVQELNDKFEEQKLINTQLIEVVEELKVKNEKLMQIIMKTDQ